MRLYSFKIIKYVFTEYIFKEECEFFEYIFFEKNHVGFNVLFNVYRLWEKDIK